MFAFYALLPSVVAVYPLCMAAWVTKQYSWYAKQFSKSKGNTVAVYTSCRPLRELSGCHTGFFKQRRVGERNTIISAKLVCLKKYRSLNCLGSLKKPNYEQGVR